MKSNTVVAFDALSHYTVHINTDMLTTDEVIIFRRPQWLTVFCNRTRGGKVLRGHLSQTITFALYGR